MVYQKIENLYLLIFALFLTVTSSFAQGSVCATVRIEIQQELSLERQAFDASMVIANGLSNTAITNLNVAVHFTDEFNQPVPGGVFFVAEPVLSGVNNVSGTGIIAPESSAEIHWLIIPTPGAAGGNPLGKIYFVGATVSYSLNGETRSIDVEPDFITVRPTPELELDYFLPIDVRADEPSTATIEPPVPFVLGVRIKNSGIAPAVNTRIQSSQPRIIRNDLGLLISFNILGSFVGNEAVMPSLLANFGEILPTESKVARWLLETNLSGRFIDFDATFVHDDSLGGQLTSLISSVNTHNLIKDVLVDLPGRDGIKDFLANDGAIIRLYESHGVDTLVTNYTSAATLMQSQTGYYIDLPPTAGPMYVKVPDPFLGGYVISGVTRGDGKEILLDNAWLSVEGLPPTNEYYLNLFDLNGGGRYDIIFTQQQLGPVPPVLQLIPNYQINAGQILSFIVQASDPNGTIPIITVDALPIGASFIDNQNGSGIFTWPTAVGQSGAYPVTFRASDGLLQTARTPTLTILGTGDADQDGIDDGWEVAHFGSLAEGGSGDFDGDGLTNLEEFLLGTDPTLVGNAPSVPIIHSPSVGVEIAVLQPALVIKNSVHGVQDPTYDFELYADEEYGALLSSSYGNPEGNIVTGWQIATQLQEDSWYYWRARAVLSGASSEWVYGRFFVNTVNAPPIAPRIVSPNDGDTITVPEFTILNSTDSDALPHTPLTYLFEVEGIVNGAVQTISSPYIKAAQNMTTWVAALPANFVPPYRYRVSAVDTLGAVGTTPWTQFNLVSGSNMPRSISMVSPVNDSKISTTSGVATLVAKRLLGPGNMTYEIELSDNEGFNFALPLAYTLTQYTVEASATNLVDDARYYWRIRSVEGGIFGPWNIATFRADIQNAAPAVPRIGNPGMGARVDLSRPMLELISLESVEDQSLTYEYEVYAESQLNNLVDSGVTNQPYWTVMVPLINHRKHYWRVRAKDDFGVYSPWSEVFNFFVSVDNVNTAPTVKLSMPGNNYTTSYSRGGYLEWADADPDSNAALHLIINGYPVNLERFEDLDGKNDISLVRPLYLSPGSYLVHPVIFDGLTYAIDTSCCSIEVAPLSPLIDDSDGDGILDNADNCRYRSNPLQEDNGGFNVQQPDGIGDLCQCGDVNGDGQVNSDDALMIRSALNLQSSTTMIRPELCNLTLNLPTAAYGCTSDDAVVIENALSNGNISELPQLCLPAII